MPVHAYAFSTSVGARPLHASAGPFRRAGVPQSVTSAAKPCLASARVSPRFVTAAARVAQGWKATNALRVQRTPTRAAAARGVLMVAATKTKVCIVNTPGGGHAVMGYYLAKELQESGCKVTICTMCEEDSKKMQKEPFTRFDELRELGVKTVWCEHPINIADTSGKFDVVIDNNGKNMDTVKPVVDWALSMGAKQFLFVSSAGMYLPTVTLPVTEQDPVKESAGHAEVERYAMGLEGMAFSSFRPQYMVGEGNNKDCEEYFFDRVVCGRPILIPGSGDQIVNIAHASDNAHMIALAVDNEKAHGQVFNCVRDKGVTLDGLVAMCGEAAGITPITIHYDAPKCGVEAKKCFPFRTEYHFFTAPSAALKLLDWEPKNDLKTDILERFEAYKKTDRMYSEKLFETDDGIIETLKWKPPEE